MTRAAVSVLVLLATSTAYAQDDIILAKGSADSARRPDHFTRYSPPALDELPPDVEVHIIQPGDTLWDLAATFLGDPYFWPQLWQENPYIVDPHWIYPQDPLVIPRPLLITEIREVLPEPYDLPPPVPVAKRHDVYCAPYIVEKERRKKRPERRREQREAGRRRAELEPRYDDVAERMDDGFGAATRPSTSRTKPWRKLPFLEPPKPVPPSIVAAEGGRIAPVEGDVIYLNRGEADGVSAGDQFLVIRPEGDVRHPETDRLVGMAMQMLGTVRVLCTQTMSATAIVESVCNNLEIGDMIRPFEPIPIPLASELPTTPPYCALPENARAEGYVLYGKNHRVSMVDEDLLTIDIGSRDGLVPGDFLIMFRPNALGSDFPATIVGDLVVLLVEDRTATAKVLNAYSAVRIGDSVRLQ